MDVLHDKPGSSELVGKLSGHFARVTSLRGGNNSDAPRDRGRSGDGFRGRSRDGDSSTLALCPGVSGKEGKLRRGEVLQLCEQFGSQGDVHSRRS